MREFYHPDGSRPEDLRRKPHTDHHTPCSDCLGHCPLIAMVHLHDPAAAGSDGVDTR